jgi:hypothetical protein
VFVLVQFPEVNDDLTTRSGSGTRQFVTFTLTLILKNKRGDLDTEAVHIKFNLLKLFQIINDI